MEQRVGTSRRRACEKLDQSEPFSSAAPSRRGLRDTAHCSRPASASRAAMPKGGVVPVDPDFQGAIIASTIKANVMNGVLTKRGSAFPFTWKQRYFELSASRELRYYENEAVCRDGGRPRGMVVVVGVRRREEAGRHGGRGAAPRALRRGRDHRVRGGPRGPCVRDVAVIASHRVASRRVASRRVASHRVASRRIASHRIASRRIASHRIASHRNASRRVASRRVASRRVASRSTAPHRIAWLAQHRTAHIKTCHPRAWPLLCYAMLCYARLG